MLIGIGGHLREGKDAVALRLVEKHGFVRIGFADQIREELICYLGRSLVDHVLDSASLGFGFFRDASNTEDALRKYLEEKPDRFARTMQQEWGRMRRAQDSGYWIAAWRRKNNLERFVNKRDIVVPDVRFLSEVDVIRNLGGVILRVTRPGYDGDRDESEVFAREYLGWDAELMNDGMLEDLWAKVDALVSEVVGSEKG